MSGGDVPWAINEHRLSDGSLNVVHVVDAAGSAVAQMFHHGEVETLRRARLSAAAPEMAEALKDVMDMYASGIGFHNAGLAERINALLTRIKGETHD